jgi:hypothetical protein
VESGRCRGEIDWLSELTEQVSRSQEPGVEWIVGALG